MNFKNLSGEAVKFTVVGIVNTLFGTSVMFLCYNLLGMNYWLSSAANYFFGSILSFFLNKYFTFRHKGNTLFSAVRFTLSIVVCYLIAYAAADSLIRCLLADAAETVRDNIAMSVGMVLFVGLNFCMQKFFVFRSKNEHAA